MITGKLTNGFEFSIKEHAFSDYTFLMKFSQFRKDPQDFEVFDELMNISLGEEQKVKFVESFMDKEGLVPFEALATGFREMMDVASAKSEEIKN